MRVFFSIGLFFFLLSTDSCRTKGEEVRIADNNISAIPDSIFKKKGLILLDIGLEGFTIYPPLSAMDSHHLMLPLLELPERLGELTSLESLRINGSKIYKLPSSIIKLKKLKKLDLSMSYNLVIVKELDKLKQLPNLRLLNIYDVIATEEDIVLLKKSLHKDLKIVTTTEEFLKDFDK